MCLRLWLRAAQMSCLATMLASTFASQPASASASAASIATTSSPAAPPRVPASTAAVFSDEEWARSAPVLARSATNSATLARSESPVGSGALAGMAVSLLAVIALAVVLGWLVKRFGIKRILPGRGTHMQVLETLPIGLKRAVTLLRVGDTVVLVGQGEHELHALGTFPISALPSLSATLPVAATPAPGAPPTLAALATDGTAQAPATLPTPPAPTPRPHSAFAALLKQRSPFCLLLGSLLALTLIMATTNVAAAVTPPPLIDPVPSAVGPTVDSPLGPAVPSVVPPAEPLPGAPVTVSGGGLRVSVEGGSGGLGSAVSLLLIITALSIAPAFLMMMTCFTRVVIVLGFLRRALGTQTLPPNQVMLGLALFLSLFIMAPTLKRVHSEALAPWVAGSIDQTEALSRAQVPVREFLLKNTRKNDLALFIHLAGEQRPRTADDVSFLTLVPAFATSELKTAFQMGFILFLPFLVIDLVVAAILMALGMMMLPPVVVSMPFKILLFVLVDGWTLLMAGLASSYH